ncbi:phosphopyruvate hydratase [Candidatus Gottesmanbacteria bacterium RBG_16_52_11]|uniref:Enolase n=1 Tax=Candidatus Gottesmanbacteria bacterium RBG_16_52_11 TaxID=1798374 RepID=A0A1F5YRC1_9BACT|nr:MAG: phosphopyruvate hydratase [Candidatus Gottesmanbacteria bacterium RBG_16_52_11]
MTTKIYSVTAREILDSRGNPTVEATVILENGYRGTSAVAAGASKGSHEAVELRDGDKKRYMGSGVLKAVENVNGPINKRIRGTDALNQQGIDTALIELDGTPNKSKLGANSVLATSMAVAVAAAASQRQPLYRYLNSLFTSFHQTKLDRIPTPTFNMINGGLHGAGNLNFQEFHIVPASNKPFHEGLEMGVSVYYSIKQILQYRNAVHSVGDEGGFAPNLFTNMDALEVLMDAIRNTHYRFGVDIYLGLDLAATQFLGENGYLIKDKPIAYKPAEFIDYLVEIHNKFHLLILEDPLAEDDWDGWKKLTSRIGSDVLIVGDDLLATNPERLKKAIEMKACTAILAKPNQIGSLSEFMNVAAIAKTHDIKIITSHRSGETTDTFVADLAVAIQSEYVKFGAPVRGERVAKYNRLLAIETEMIAAK